MQTVISFEDTRNEVFGGIIEVGEMLWVSTGRESNVDHGAKACIASKTIHS